MSFFASQRNRKRTRGARGVWEKSKSSRLARSVQQRGINHSSVLEKLTAREVKTFDSSRSFVSASYSEACSGMRLQGEFDTQDHEATHLKLSFLKERSHVTEITAHGSVVCALTSNGLCAVYNRDIRKQVCVLNITPDEVIRTVFYNIYNDSIIVVSVYRSDHFLSLRCRTIPLEYVKRGRPDLGWYLFENESLCYPGFVELDETNGKVVTQDATSRIHKVWDLGTYKLLFSVVDENIQEIKICPGVILLMYKRTSNFIPLKVMSIENGTVLKSFKHMLHRNKRIDFVEQFNEKLLIKQEGEAVKITDIETMETTTISQTIFSTPRSFIFLHKIHLFLTLLNQSVYVWNLQGELVTTFEDHSFFAHTAGKACVADAQDRIVSYCRDTDSPGNTKGAIHISNVFTGKLLAKVGVQATCSNAAYAEEAVTAVYYDEERNEVISGNASGRVFIWGV